jgi:hypothetical protein
MSKTNKQTPRKGNLSEKGTNTSSSSGTSMSKTDDSDFTVVSYMRKTRAATAHSGQAITTTSNSTATDTTNVNGQDWLMVTSWQFKEFQKEIVPIIETIVTTNSKSTHPFIQRWLEVNKGAYAITPTSTFHAVNKALQLTDIQEYRRFLRTAPQVERYVTLGDSNSSGTGFYYKIHNGHPDENVIDPGMTQSGKTSHKPETEENEEIGTKTPTVLVSTNSIKEESAQNEGKEDLEEQVAMTESITTTGTIHKVCYGVHEDF